MTTTATQIRSQGAALVASKDTCTLVEMFELTDTLRASDTDEAAILATTRGWIMDALRDRNADAFDAWMDSDADSPRRYFVGA